MEQEALVAIECRLEFVDEVIDLAGSLLYVESSGPGAASLVGEWDGAHDDARSSLPGGPPRRGRECCAETRYFSIACGEDDGSST